MNVAADAPTATPRRPTRRRRAWLLAAAAAVSLTAALAGCGSDGDSSPAPTPTPAPTPPPGPGGNQPPVASFTTATATIAAGSTLAFDASASSDPDGDALSHHWNFGDSTHGGHAKLAHIYTAAGTYTVTLTVSDGRGGAASTTRAITVTAGPAATGTTNTLAVVTDGTGPLAGVTVAVAGGASATTAADGTATVATPLGVPVQITFNKPGYAGQMKQLNLPAGATSGYVTAQLLVREPALTLADAAAGGTLTGKHGARIVLPPNALVDGAGNAVTGPVQIAMTPVNVGADTRNFPGLFQGITPAGDMQVLLSYGTVEYVLTSNGAPVQLRPGVKATIDIPIYTGLHRDGSAVAAGQTTALWSLDERTSQWIEEGAGTVIAVAGSPSDFALRAEVGHFSWWNCDVGENPYRPNGKCCIKDEPNGPCKENSGDVCEHYGTGPRGGPSSNSSPLMAKLQAASMTAATFPSQASPTAEPDTRRIPATAAQATVNAMAGGELPMPANMDITVVSSARNGTYRGTRVFRGANGVREDVVVTLLPVASGGQDEPITLPWDKAYSMTATGELDRFLLTMAAGPGFSVRVSQASSTLAGTVRLIRPDGTLVTQQGFTGTPAMLNEPQAMAGVYKIEVTSTAGAPGGYRLEASSLGDCASVTVVTPPVNRVDPMAARSNRCYDVAFAADQAVQVRTDRETNLNNSTGTVTLATAGGAQTLMVFTGWGGTFANPAHPIIFGIAQAATYRIRVSNDSDSSGTFRFIVQPLTTTTLAVPGSATIDVPANSSGTQAYVLLKPPADGRYFLQMDTTSFSGGVNLFPSFANIANHRAIASQTMTPLLPVAVVFSNSTAGTATLTSGVPTTITRDVDISGTVGDTPVVYALDGVAGTEIAKRMVRPDASPVIATMDFFNPEGGVMGAFNAVETLPATGVYTAYIRRTSASGSTPYTLRVNTAPAPVPLTLTPPLTQVSVDMPIGMVRRYTMDLAQADVLTLSLDTTSALSAVAVVEGEHNAVVQTPDGLTGPKSAFGLPAYVRLAGNKTLRVYTQATELETASGPLTVGVRKPVPAPKTFNAPFDALLAPGIMDAWRYDVPAEGYYLLRLTAPQALSGSATIWAPSTPLSNYTGELSVGSIASEPEGYVKLGAGSHTLTLRAAPPPTLTAPVNFSVSLVNLEAPVPLTLGAAPSAGTIDAAAERDYFSFTGTGSQSYTVRVTAAFNGVLRVKKLTSNGDYVYASPLSPFIVPGFPTPFATGIEKVVAFTIPANATFGNGTYIVDIDADGIATGNYSVAVTTP